MGPDIIPSRRFRSAAWIAAITACFVLAGAGGAAAGMRYDARSREIVFPGVVVGGVALGGKTLTEAERLLEERFEQDLDRPITVLAGGSEFVTTAKELGATTDAIEQFKRATKKHGALPMAQRVWYRLTGNVIENELPVNVTVDRTAVRSYVDRLAESTDRPAKDASVAVGQDGQLSVAPEVAGFQLDRTKAVELLASTVTSGAIKVTLAGNTTEPAVKQGDFRDVLVVQVSENKLYHYRSGQLLKVYGVATGTPRYPTPKGQFKIINKRKNPTWVNPAPRGWGAGMPARIGPGRSNPLGTRALDLNSPGIRIHGTSKSGSIGTYASHGCIRMHMNDVEELFELVEVGTPVLIVGRTGRARVSRTPDPEEPLAENDGTQVPGQQPEEPREPGPSEEPSQPPLVPAPQ